MQKPNKILKKVALSAPFVTAVALPVSCTVTAKIDNGLNDVIKDAESYLNSKEVKEILNGDIKVLKVYQQAEEYASLIREAREMAKDIPSTTKTTVSSELTFRVVQAKKQLQTLVKEYKKAKEKLKDENGKAINLEEITKNFEKTVSFFQKQIVDDENYEKVKNGGWVKPIRVNKMSPNGNLPWKKVKESETEIPYSDLEKNTDKFYSSEFTWELNQADITYEFIKQEDEKVNIRYNFPNILSMSQGGNSHAIETQLEEEYIPGEIDKRIKINEVKLEGKFESEEKKPAWIADSHDYVYNGVLVKIETYNAETQEENYKYFVLYSFRIKTSKKERYVGLLFDFPAEILKDYKK